MSSAIEDTVTKLNSTFGSIHTFITSILAAATDSTNVLYVSYPYLQYGSKLYEWWAIKLSNADIVVKESKQQYKIEFSITGAGVHGFNNCEGQRASRALEPGKPLDNDESSNYHWFVEAGKINLAIDMENGFDRNGKLTFSNPIGINTTRFDDDIKFAEITTVDAVKDFIKALPVMRIINRQNS